MPKEIVYTPGTGMKSPIVSVAPHGLSFNAPAAELLGNPEKVLVKIWPEEWKVVFVATDNNDPKGLKFYGSMRDSMIRLASRNLTKFIEYNIEGFTIPEKATRFGIFPTTLDNRKALILDLNDPVM